MTAQVVVTSNSTAAVPGGGIAAACVVDPKRRPYLEVPPVRFSGLDKLGGGCAGQLMGKKPTPPGIGSISCELTVDELKKRLSHLIGVSLCEMETLFDGHEHELCMT